MFLDVKKRDRSVRQAIRNYEITFEPDDFPCFLWEGETADASNLKKGFLRGEILARVCNFTLLCTPHAHQCSVDYVVHSTWTLCCANRSGFWCRWLCGQNQHAVHYNSHRCICCSCCKLSWSTALMLANVSVQARHALTTDSKFIWTTDGTGYSYLTFYHTIIKTVLGWSQVEQTRLIQWWNEYVLQYLITNWPFLILHAFRTSLAESCHGSEDVLGGCPHKTIPGPSPPPRSCVNKNREVEPNRLAVNLQMLSFCSTFGLIVSYYWR